MSIVVLVKNKEGIQEMKEKLNMDPLTIGCSLSDHIHESVMSFISLFLSLFLERSSSLHSPTRLKPQLPQPLIESRMWGFISSSWKQHGVVESRQGWRLTTAG